MVTLISIGFVEILKLISGLLTSARVVLNALVYNLIVYKSSGGPYSSLPLDKNTSQRSYPLHV